MTRLKRRKELPSTHTNDVRFGTPELAAEYRAKRLAALKPDMIIEVGAGAGFQTQAFSKVAKQVIAVDIDAERLQRATMPKNTTAIAGDALDPAVVEDVRKRAQGNIVIFLDPERPPASAQRTLNEVKPDIKEFLKQYSAISQSIAIELPPFLDDIPFDCEREYLSIDGKLNRLTIYTGSLKRCDTSVVRLPEDERLEHNGDARDGMSELRAPAKFVLEPDAALQHAGLVGAAIAVPVKEESLGKRSILLSAEQPASVFFTAYRIIAAGKQQIEKVLPRQNCATVILHGALSQEEQRALLQRLNKLCKGKRRLHLFLGEQWYLTVKVVGAVQK